VIKMSMVPWKSLPELMSLQQAMDRLLENSLIRPSRTANIFGMTPILPIDVYQTPNEIVAKAALPRVEPEDDGIEAAKLKKVKSKVKKSIENEKA